MLCIRDAYRRVQIWFNSNLFLNRYFLTYYQYCTLVHTVQQPIVFTSAIKKIQNYCQLQHTIAPKRLLVYFKDTGYKK
jgi:hypothetical protein